MCMTETQLSVKVLKYLNSFKRCKAIKIHGSRYQEAGTPDILCCYEGKTFFFELKVGDNELSDIQDIRISQWNEAGAQCYVCWSLSEVMSIFNDALKTLPQL